MQKPVEIKKTSTSETEGGSANEVKTSQPAKSSEPAVKGKVKAGSKISFKVFVFGCLFFFVIFMLLIFFGLYFGVKNPSVLKSVGLDVDTTKKMLMAFAVLIFGLIFFVGFLGALFNGYRVATVKTSKLRYGLGLAGSSFAILIALILGTISIWKIRNIESGTKYATTNAAIDVYLVGKKLNVVDGSFINIAPAMFKFKVNRGMFNSLIMPKITLQNPKIESLQLDCGNGQILYASPAVLLTNNDSQTFFDGGCLYMKKGTYKNTLLVNAYDKTGKPSQFKFDLKPLIIKTEINIKSKFSLNDAQNLIVLDNAPVRVQVDANNVFKDLGLNYKIAWDFDGDGKADVEDNAVASYQYTQAGPYDIVYQIEELGDIDYIIPVTVPQSGLNPCEITVSPNSKGSYDISVYVKDPTVVIKDYKYEYLDLNNDKKPENIAKPTKSQKTSYKFKNSSKYIVRVTYTTKDKKTGYCESSEIDTASYEAKIDYSVAVKLPDDNDFSEATISGNNIIVSKTPSDLRFTLNKVDTEIQNYTVELYIDDEKIEKSDENVFEYTVEDEKLYNGKFIVNLSQNKKIERPFIIEVKKLSIEPKLKVTPDTGEDPVVVTLDASATKLNEVGDEILYFSWIYGDGVEHTNVSQGTVTHTYSFNKDTNNGVYNPKVKIFTKKGYEAEAEAKVIVTRKAKTVNISFDSHPTQTALIGDAVRLSINTDGMIKRISWDFGNGSTISGEGRERSEIVTHYDSAGTYEITVKVEYEDTPMIVSKAKIKITE